MRHRSIAALVVVLAATASAEANPKAEAKKHVDKATALFEKGQAAEAADELKTAYALDPRPELLYAIGQTYWTLGQCADAKTFYRRFLATKPPRDSAKAARDAMAACKNKPKPKKVKPPPDLPPPDPPPADPPPTPSPPITTPKPVTTTTTTTTTHHVRWYTDYVGHVLVIGGLGAGVFGLIEYNFAKSDREAADTAGDFQMFSDLIDSANRKRTIAIVAGVAGGALVISGLVHYMLHSRTEQRVQVVPTSGGAAVSWGGSF
jgi:hypothetical protein